MGKFGSPSQQALPRRAGREAAEPGGGEAPRCREVAPPDAISVQQNGKAAAATTIARKRSVLANVIRYAVELEEMPSNPLDRLTWTPPKASEVVDRRVVVNPRQARALLTAVTYVGQQRRGPHARGQHGPAWADRAPRDSNARGRSPSSEIWRRRTKWDDAVVSSWSWAI